MNSARTSVRGMIITTSASVLALGVLLAPTVRAQPAAAGPAGAGIRFGTPVKFPAAGPVRTSAWGDLDLDGDDDIVALLPDDGAGNGRVQVFLNQGRTLGGTWLGFVPLPPVGVGMDPTGIAVETLDDDAFPDVATSNAGDDSLTLLFGDGTGAFPTAQTIFLAGGAAPSDLALAELTGNARNDIAVPQRGLDNVEILSNDASPLVGGAIIVTNPQTIFVGDEPSAIDPEDMEGDKDTDLVVTNFIGDSITYLRDDGAGLVVAQTIALDPFDRPTDVIARDFDNSGVGDIAAALEGGMRIAIIRDLGGALTAGGVGGPYGPPQYFNVNGAPTSISAGDYDLDGDRDVAVTAPDGVIGPSVKILENTLEAGPFNLTLLSAIDVNASPNHVLTVDLNDDGRPDLVTSNNDNAFPGQGSLSVLLSEVVASELVNTEGETTVDCDTANNNPGPGDNNDCATTTTTISCNGSVVGSSGTWTANPPCVTDPDCQGAPGGCDLVTGTCVDAFTFRDLDWYDLTIAVDGDKAFRISSAFAVNLFLFQEAPDCANLVQLFGFVGPGNDEPLVVESAPYPAGDYKLLVTFDFASGAPCGEAYFLEALCEAACPADVDGSGSVGFTDLNVVLSGWGPCPEL